MSNELNDRCRTHAEFSSKNCPKCRIETLKHIQTSRNAKNPLSAEALVEGLQDIIWYGPSDSDKNEQKAIHYVEKFLASFKKLTLYNENLASAPASSSTTTEILKDWQATAKSNALQAEKWMKKAADFQYKTEKQAALLEKMALALTELKRWVRDTHVAASALKQTSEALEEYNKLR